MFLLGLMLCFFITNSVHAERNDLWEMAWKCSFYKDTKFLKPIYDREQKNCFCGVYFRDYDIIPLPGYERFSVSTLMDVPLVYGGDIDRIYGFICPSEQIKDELLFDLLTNPKIFRINIACVDRFTSGYCLTHYESDYFLEQQNNENFDVSSQGEETFVDEGKIEHESQETSFKLEPISAQLDKAANGETLFMEVLVFNNTCYDMLVIPSKMLCRLGFSNGMVVKKGNSKQIYFPRIRRFCDNTLEPVLDFYQFDNHVLIYKIYERKDDTNLLPNQEDTDLKVKYIACVPLPFNEAEEVKRHISQIKIEQMESSFLVDSQVL